MSFCGLQSVLKRFLATTTPLHSENGLIGAFRGHSRDRDRGLGRFVANQDLRSGGRVHHLDYPGIHVRLGGESVGRKAT